MNIIDIIYVIMALKKKRIQLNILESNFNIIIFIIYIYNLQSPEKKQNRKLKKYIYIIYF